MCNYLLECVVHRLHLKNAFTVQGRAHPSILWTNVLKGCSSGKVKRDSLLTHHFTANVWLLENVHALHWYGPLEAQAAAHSCHRRGTSERPAAMNRHASVQSSSM